jgi:hypothetical protein
MLPGYCRIVQLAHYIETFDRVTINWGHHMVYKPDHSLKSWEEVSGLPEHYLTTCSCVGAGKILEIATKDGCVDFIQEFKVKIVPFVKTIHGIPGALEKITWVQTTIMPLTNRYLNSSTK